MLFSAGFAERLSIVRQWGSPPANVSEVIDIPLAICLRESVNIANPLTNIYRIKAALITF